MNVSHKKLGLSIVALAVALIGSAAIADNAGPPPGPGGPGHMGMMQPQFDFAAADANKDGKVTPEEFAAFRAATVAAIDTDKDGKLSADELAAMNLKAMESMAKTRADHMIKMLDTDGDSKLSAAELVAGPLPPDAFAMMDTNHDGAVDQAEADAAAKAMQHGPGDMMGGHKHHKGPDNKGPDNKGSDNQGGDNQGGDNGGDPAGDKTGTGGN